MGRANFLGLELNREDKIVRGCLEGRARTPENEKREKKERKNQTPGPGEYHHRLLYMGSDTVITSLFPALVLADSGMLMEFYLSSLFLFLFAPRTPRRIVKTR
jgi:hypothetical protein